MVDVSNGPGAGPVGDEVFYNVGQIWVKVCDRIRDKAQQVDMLTHRQSGLPHLEKPYRQGQTVSEAR
jgi:hypothetical protein